MDKRLNLLYEDEEMLVCYKKAGLAVQSAKVGQTDLESLVRTYLVRKTGNSQVYVSAIHRIDQPVEGIVLFAKTKRAAADLSGQIKEHMADKYYLAVVEGLFDRREAVLTDYLEKDAKTNTSQVVKMEKLCPKDGGKAKESRLSYHVLAEGDSRQLLEVHLITGRHHQIRVQLSHAGHPIVGDYKYNPQGQYAQRDTQLALCAYKLAVTHPVTKERTCFTEHPRGSAFNEFSQYIK